MGKRLENRIKVNEKLKNMYKDNSKEIIKKEDESEGDYWLMKEKRRMKIKDPEQSLREQEQNGRKINRQNKVEE